MAIPTLEEFLKKAYEDTPKDKRPKLYKDWIKWFIDTEEHYKNLYIYDDGK